MLTEDGDNAARTGRSKPKPDFYRQLSQGKNVPQGAKAVGPNAPPA